MKRASSNLAALFVVAVMVLAALSLWTVVPLGWLWVGSRLSSTQAPSGGPYMVVFVGILFSILLIAWILSRLNHLYARITGGTEVYRIRPAWTKSMRDEHGPVRRTTVLEAIVLTSVILAAVAGTVWFLFIAGSPLGSY